MTVVVYEQPLQDYMDRRGLSHISVKTVSSKKNRVEENKLFTSFESNESADLLRSQGARVLQGERGDVLLSDGLEIGDVLVLGLHSFFGMKGITVHGISPWTL